MERVSLFYLNTGGGHAAAANALSESMMKRGDAEPRLCNPLEECSPALRTFIEGGYGKLSTEFKFLWPLFYNASRSDAQIRSIRFLTRQLLTDAVLLNLAETRPEKLVILHYLLIEPVYRAMEILGIPGERAVTIVLDPYSVHPLWFELNPFPMICFSPDAEQTIRASAGDGTHRIERYPMIISERFDGPDRNAALSGEPNSSEEPKPFKEKDRPPRLLIQGGGEGNRKSLRVLRRLLAEGTRMDITFVCGKSESLYRKARHISDSAGINQRVSVIGFANNMEELIAKSDLILTKAGPASVMESLLLEKPLIIYDYMYGQEKGNVDFVLNNGLGAYLKRCSALTRLIREMTAPAFLRGFKNRLEELKLCRGTDQIVSRLMESPSCA